MLSTVDAVLTELGGPVRAAELAGVGASAVSNWRSRKRLPADLYLVFSEALGRTGKTADPALFGLKTQFIEVEA